MRKQILSISSLVVFAILLTGCASMQTPEPRSDHYYCTPDSAIKHRGLAADHGRLARPVARTGTCRHQ